MYRRNAAQSRPNEMTALQQFALRLESPDDWTRVVFWSHQSRSGQSSSKRRQIIQTFARRVYRVTKKWRENLIVIIIYEKKTLNVMSSSDTETKNLRAVHTTKEKYDTDER